MLRLVPIPGLVALFILLANSVPVPAQQFRKLTPAPPPAPMQNNLNNPKDPNHLFNPGKVVGFKVLGANGQNNANVPLGNNPGAVNNLLNNVPNQGINPFGANPYSGFAGSTYGFNPYGFNPYGFNPYGYGYSPYYFWNTGIPTGGYNNLYGGYPHPAQLYNMALNWQYLSDPHLNPLSNPAFSGPFPPGVFSSTAALGAMGFANILANFPLNPGGTLGNNPPLP